MENKKSIQIKDSYKIWRPSIMYGKIMYECFSNYDSVMAEQVLNRSYIGMYLEWWLHNIGYYLTRNIACLEAINLRCKDVDLEEK
jgi:hypothetical protein